MSQCKYYTIVTTLGLNKIQSKSRNNEVVRLTHMGFSGDENGSYVEPDMSATSLPNQWAKIALERHPDEGFIGGGATITNKAEEHKGKFITLVGIYDDEDDLIFITSTISMEMARDSSVVSSYPIDIFTVLDNASSVVVVTDTSITHPTHEELNNALNELYKEVTKAATTTKSGIIELATQEEVDLGEDEYRAITPKTLNESVLAKRLRDVSDIVDTLGAAVQMWLGDVVPNTHTELDGKSFDKAQFPIMATLFPSGVLLDTRGMVLKHINGEREVLSYEADQNKAHDHAFSGSGSAHYNDTVANRYLYRFGDCNNKHKYSVYGHSGNVNSTNSLSMTISGTTASNGGDQATVRNIGVKFIIRKA